MKFYKALMDMDMMYVTIWVSTQQCVNNITYTIITLYYPCGTEFTNDALQFNVIFQNYDKVDYEQYIITAETAYHNYNGPFDLVVRYCIKFTFNAADQMISNLYCIIFRRHYKFLVYPDGLPKT